MVKERKTKKPAKSQVGVRLDAEIKEKLDAIAAKEERTPAQIARIAIKQFIERREQTA
jgi:predicted transcriptional regulator